MLKQALSLFLFCILTSPVVLATDQVRQEADEQLLLALQADMQTYSDIATDTKQNADYMPYVISTLNYQQLSQLGVTTLREALKLVPGVDLSIGLSGAKTPIFRGSNPYSFGQTKLIINGTVMNDQMFGAYNQYLEMPIDVIHRIEVVRGPGSLVNHVNGYAGSIHVVTKSKRDDGEPIANEVFVGAASHKGHSAGGVLGFQQGDFSLSSDFYFQRHELTLASGEDYFGRSGTLDESLENYQIGVNLGYQALTVTGRFSNNESGVSSGQAFSLTEDTSDYLKVTDNSVNINYQKKITDGVTASLTFGYLDEARKLQNKFIPDGAVMDGVSYPQGNYFLVDYVEETLSQKLEFDIQLLADHKITAGVFLSQSDISRNHSAMSNDGLDTLSYTDLFTNSGRDYTSAYLEDLINLNDKTTLQLGVKVEKYSDVDMQISPRVSLVYRHDNANIFKAMYSHAYREPSWREQYTAALALYCASNPDLRVELVDAYELAYIRKLSRESDFRVNLFYLENRDQMQASSSHDTFDNKDKNTLYGSELEYSGVFEHGGRLALNYSYVEGENIGGLLVNTSSHMATAYYIHPFSRQWSASVLYKIVGDKERSAVDKREALQSYSTVDLATQYTLNSIGLTITGGIKNALDAQVTLPAPAGTYQDDFQQDGRSFFIRMKKAF